MSDSDLIAQFLASKSVTVIVEGETSTKEYRFAKPDVKKVSTVKGISVDVVLDAVEAIMDDKLYMASSCYVYSEAYEHKSLEQFLCDNLITDMAYQSFDDKTKSVLKDMCERSNLAAWEHSVKQATILTEAEKAELKDLFIQISTLKGMEYVYKVIGHLGGVPDIKVDYACLDQYNKELLTWRATLRKQVQEIASYYLQALRY